MFLSVIIPAYNEEQYLSACLDSFSRQTLDPKYFEIIVIDNNSTDQTASIAKRYPVKLVSEKRQSVILARQKGVNSARGDIIVSTDADTIYPPDFLKKIYLSFQKYPSLVAVVGWTYYRYTPAWFNLTHSLIQRTNLWLGKTTGRFPVVFAANFSFRKSALVQIGGYPAHLPELGDQQYLLFKFRQLGPIMINPRIYCRTSARKLSGQYLKNLLIYNGWHRLIGSLINSLFKKEIIGPTPAQRSHF